MVAHIRAKKQAEYVRRMQSFYQRERIEKHRKVDEYLQKELSDGLKTEVLERKDGSTVRLYDLLARYGYALCDAELAHQHLEVLRTHGHGIEAFEARQKQYGEILSYDTDYKSQLPASEYSDYDRKAYKQYFWRVFKRFRH